LNTHLPHLHLHALAAQRFSFCLRSPRVVADHGQTEMVKMLLDAGADPAAADENRKDCVTMSKEAGQTEIETLLRDSLAQRQAVEGKDEV
jgi:hypothetical protein